MQRLTEKEHNILADLYRNAVLRPAQITGATCPGSGDRRVMPRRSQQTKDREDRECQ